MKLAKLCFFFVFFRGASLGPCTDCLARNVDLQPLAAKLPPGSVLIFLCAQPKSLGPLKVLLRHRREPKSSVGENKVSTSLHPASDTWRYIQEEMNARHQCCCPHPEPHALTETSTMGCCLPPWQR